jgi:hypothetical protein
MAILDVPQRFSQKWVHDKVPTMDSTEFHAMFHEAATRGWDEDELRQLARMWSRRAARLSPPANPAWLRARCAAALRISARRPRRPAVLLRRSNQPPVASHTRSALVIRAASTASFSTPLAAASRNRAFTSSCRSPSIAARIRSAYAEALASFVLNRLFAARSTDFDASLFGLDGRQALGDALAHDLLLLLDQNLAKGDLLRSHPGRRLPSP